MKKKTKGLYLLLFVLLISFLLSACGNGETVNEQNSNTTNKEDITENGDQTSLADKQVLNINISTEPPKLNPGMVSDTTSAAVLKAVFEGLTRINPNNEVENAQAKDITLSDDKLTYTITLREDIKWSNGDPVTAQDFAFAWKWMLHPQHEAPKSFRLFVIKNAEKARSGEVPVDEVGIKILNDNKFQVTLEQPTPYFKSLLAMPTFFPVNAKVVKENPEWYLDAGSDYVSNGPFTLDKWEHKNEIVLKKNDDYWDKEHVHLNKISMVMINDANTELNMFNNGELDWAGGPLGQLPLAAISTVKKEGKLTAFPISGKRYITINTNKKPFNNAKIRKAFALAINRKGIVENITQGGETPSTAFIPSAMWEENKDGYFQDHDVKKAKIC